MTGRTPAATSLMPASRLIEIRLDERSRYDRRTHYMLGSQPPFVVSDLFGASLPGEVIAAKKPTRVLVIGFEQLKHFIVEQAAFPQARKEHSALNGSRIKPVLERLVHIPRVTATRNSVTWTFIYQLKQAALYLRSW